ncbi:MAG: DeoR/GlpR family DNA-binding transcription regulator [Solobacterium sp.]|nr:DeoR/GlpR family DNA-binding transcription regulator [Solobacterium sp.]
MNPKIYTEERRGGILQLLREQGSVSVAGLSEKYRVSGTTIRIDLTALENEGLLQRTHGGAVPVSDLRQFIREPLISERRHYEEKKRIASAALSLLSPGETVLLDTGTTMTCFAEALAASAAGPLTVYSNDLRVLETLETKENCALRILGGSIRSGFHYTYGQQALDELGRYHFKKLFLATSALNENGLTVSNGDLAALKRAMIRSAEEVILLTDSSKAGLLDFEKFAGLGDIDVLITDSGIEEKNSGYLKDSIPRIIIV